MTIMQEQLLSPISKIVLLLALIVITPALVAAQVWSVLTFDTRGDGRVLSAELRSSSHRLDNNRFLGFA